MADEEQVAEALDGLDDRELQMFVASRLVAIEKELRSIGWWVTGAVCLWMLLLGVGLLVAVAG